MALYQWLMLVKILKNLPKPFFSWPFKVKEGQTPKQQNGESDFSWILPQPHNVKKSLKFRENDRQF